jgi:hypothetical protein
MHAVRFVMRLVEEPGPTSAYKLEYLPAPPSTTTTDGKQPSLQ